MRGLTEINMKKEQTLLLKLISFSLFNINNINKNDFDNISIQDLLVEASFHKVSPFVIDALLKCNSLQNADVKLLSEAYKQELRNILLQYVIDYKRLEYEQSKIISLLYSKNIEVSVIKGTALAEYYPNPALRSMSDIDLYISPNQLDDAAYILKSNGFSHEKTSTIYHKEFSKDNIIVELHNSFAGLPEGKTRYKMSFLKDLYCRGYEHSCPHDLSIYHTPNIYDDGIIQLCHIIHHIHDGGMKIRLLMDWMMFIKQNINNTTWFDTYENVLQEIKLDRMAKVITKSCQVLFNCFQNDITWFEDIDSSECAKFIEYVIDRRKKMSVSPTKSHFERTLSVDIWETKSSDSCFYYLKILYKNIVLIIQRKRTLNRVFQLISEKEKRRKFLHELNLFSYKDAKDYSME